MNNKLIYFVTLMSFRRIRSIIFELIGSDCKEIIDNLLMNAISLAVGICFLRLKNIISMHSAKRFVFSIEPVTSIFSKMLYKLV